MNGSPPGAPRPICYMVMPFRKKKVEDPRPAGAPIEIDFDALWERAYWPAIETLGYVPMRADFDAASAIVKAMLERIAFADLVVADVTLGNGNVYYEVGIRHVAQDARCVLVAPTWCKPLFDISQFASIRFPLADGSVPQAEADVIRDLLREGIPRLKDARSPYHELLAGSIDDSGRRSAFADFARQLNTFQAEVKAVRLETDDVARRSRLATLLSTLQPSALEIPEVALDVIGLVRDHMTWTDLRRFIEGLPPRTRALPFAREQYLLALAESGDPRSAIAQLETLITEIGNTPERQGLIGGRYKRLWLAARKARVESTSDAPSLDERRYLEQAIAHYTAGMELDYNQYYCSNNLPTLLRARNEDGDVERAIVVDHFVVAACERAMAHGSGDEWLRATLLGAAFRAGDAKRAAALAKQVALEGAAQWKLDSTLKDLAESIRQTADPNVKARLQIVFEQLAALVRTGAAT